MEGMQFKEGYVVLPIGEYKRLVELERKFKEDLIKIKMGWNGNLQVIPNSRLIYEIARTKLKQATIDAKVDLKDFDVTDKDKFSMFDADIAKVHKEEEE